MLTSGSVNIWLAGAEVYTKPLFSRPSNISQGKQFYIRFFINKQLASNTRTADINKMPCNLICNTLTTIKGAFGPQVVNMISISFTSWLQHEVVGSSRTNCISPIGSASSRLALPASRFTEVGHLSF